MLTIFVDLAFSYSCPNCRHLNFLRSIPVELDFEDRREVERMGMRHDSFVRPPDIAKCGKCGYEVRIDQHQCSSG